MVHEDFKEMLAMHALSALDADDQRALDQHLSECVECRRELADWEDTAAALALSARPAEPSAEVRDRIMGAVRSEKQRAQQNAPAQGAHARDPRVQQDARAQDPRAQQDARAQQEPRVVPFRRSFRETWASFGQVGAIAAAVLCLVLIIWIIVLVQQNRALHRENNTLAGQNQWMEKELGSSEQLVRLLSQPGARLATLRGTDEAEYATAYFVYDRSGQALLWTRGLSQTPAGKEYQLWFIVGKNPPIPGRTFTVDNAGRGELSDEIPRQAMESAVFAVTLEPAGGVTAPTGAIYLSSSSSE